MVQATTISETATQEAIRPVLLTRHRRRLAGAKDIATEAKGELPSLKEFILWLEDKENYSQAKRDWYWLREEPNLNLIDPCRIEYKKGTLKSVSKEEWDTLDEDKKARFHPGNGSLCLGVGLTDCKSGLTAFADASPDHLARVAYVKQKPKPEASVQPEILLRQ
ncbi:TPA: hypothetical protein HA310_00065 [Candidatus Micrarchaeota archaeon]|jgi:hypothetical protein|nr:hypothetical protein [Candidatus Micrarchaeota archaeon]